MRNEGFGLEQEDVEEYVEVDVSPTGSPQNANMDVFALNHGDSKNINKRIKKIFILIKFQILLE